MIDWVSIVRQSTNRRISNCIYLVPRGRRQRHKRERVQQQKQAEADAAEAERCQRQEDNDIYEEVGFFSSAPDASTTEGIEDQSSFSASTVCCFMRVSFFFLSFRSTQLRVVLFFFILAPARSPFSPTHNHLHILFLHLSHSKERAINEKKNNKNQIPFVQTTEL